MLSHPRDAVGRDAISTGIDRTQEGCVDKRLWIRIPEGSYENSNCYKGSPRLPCPWGTYEEEGGGGGIVSLYWGTLPR